MWIKKNGTAAASYGPEQTIWELGWRCSNWGKGKARKKKKVRLEPVRAAKSYQLNTQQHIILKTEIITKVTYVVWKDEDTRRGLDRAVVQVLAGNHDLSNGAGDSDHKKHNGVHRVDRWTTMSTLGLAHWRGLGRLGSLALHGGSVALGSSWGSHGCAALDVVKGIKQNKKRKWKWVGCGKTLCVPTGEFPLKLNKDRWEFIVLFMRTRILRSVKEEGFYRENKLRSLGKKKCAVVGTRPLRVDGTYRNRYRMCQY